MQINSDIEHYKKGKKTAEQALSEAEADLQTAKNHLEMVIKEATKHCPDRIPNDQITLTREQIERKISKMRRELARMENEYDASDLLLIIVLEWLKKRLVRSSWMFMHSTKQQRKK